MTKTRRDFIKQASVAAAALTVPQRGVFLAPRSPTVPQGVDAFYRDVCILALDAARAAHATYADVRIVNRRKQYVSVRDSELEESNDTETLGIGVRVLVDGAWGFASIKDVTRQNGRLAAEDAVRRARSNSAPTTVPVELAPVDAYPNGSWQSPIRRDPFAIPVSEKVELLQSVNNVALRVPSIRSAHSFLSFVRDEKTFASTDGSIIAQTVFRSWPSLTATTISSDATSALSRSTTDIPPMGLGFEHVLSANLPERARELAIEAVRGLSATSVEPGEYDLILDPTNLQFALHETIGRATELDHALASSFLAFPEDVIGKLQFGPEFMNVLCDRTQRGGLATVGWDDEGVPQDSWPVISDGIFVDYQTTRQNAGRIAALTGMTRSHGCAVAESWDHVQLQRMPNVSLLPGEDEYNVDDLIAATDHGIYVKGVGASTLDRANNTFQFSGESCYEVRNGRIVGELKDVAYRSSTLDFWNSMDMLGGPDSYVLGGIVDEKKGQPEQTHSVSHGCPPARFSQCMVVNTAG
jgi:TldD protein